MSETKHIHNEELTARHLDLANLDVEREVVEEHGAAQLDHEPERPALYRQRIRLQRDKRSLCEQHFPLFM